jgi:hypothetical protein
MGEPKFGYKNLVKSKKDGKVKAFFNLLIPTESIGTIELSGFKVVEGGNGPFISLPNRAVTAAVRTTVDTESGQAEGSVDGVKYYNNIRFESKERYAQFRQELNDNVLPLLVEQLAN